MQNVVKMGPAEHGQSWPGAEAPWGEPPAQGVWDGLLKLSGYDREPHPHPAEWQRGLGSRAGSVLAAWSFPAPRWCFTMARDPCPARPVGYTLPNVFYLNANFDFSLSSSMKFFRSAMGVTIIIYPQVSSYRYWLYRRAGALMAGRAEREEEREEKKGEGKEMGRRKNGKRKGKEKGVKDRPQCHKSAGLGTPSSAPGATGSHRGWPSSGICPSPASSSPCAAC